MPKKRGQPPKDPIRVLVRAYKLQAEQGLKEATAAREAAKEAGHRGDELDRATHRIRRRLWDLRRRDLTPVDLEREQLRETLDDVLVFKREEREGLLQEIAQKEVELEKAGWSQSMESDQHISDLVDELTVAERQHQKDVYGPQWNRMLNFSKGEPPDADLIFQKYERAIAEGENRRKGINLMREYLQLRALLRNSEGSR